MKPAWTLLLSAVEMPRRWTGKAADRMFENFHSASDNPRKCLNSKMMTTRVSSVNMTTRVDFVNWLSENELALSRLEALCSCLTAWLEPT